VQLPSFAFALTRDRLQSGGALSSLVFESIAEGKSKGGIDADMAQVRCGAWAVAAAAHMLLRRLSCRRWQRKRMTFIQRACRCPVFKTLVKCGCNALGWQVPKEFWRLCNCSAPLLVRSDPKHASETLRQLFHSIGERIKAADAQYAAGLFNDYCLPKIALTLRMQPSMCVLSLAAAGCCRNEKV
jgi:hypothetical protein